MNFPKFLSLINSSSLFFAKGADLLKYDKWEGSYPDKELQAYIHSYLRFIKNSSRLSEEDKIKEVKKMLGDSQLRDKTFFSSWYLGQDESYSIWKAYSESNSGVAIVSSIDSMITAFKDFELPINIGEVKYLDYKNDIFSDHFAYEKSFLNAYLPMMSKRKIFKDENECRMVISLWDDEKLKKYEHNNGVYVPVNLEHIIEKVILGPDSPSWYKNEMQNLLIKYGISLNVVPSELDENPG